VRRDERIQVVTAAHVVSDALSRKELDFENALVGVYFPMVQEEDENKARKARVSAVLEGYNDDVALLELLDAPAPMEIEKAAVLGAAGDSEDNPFKAYGYAPLPGHKSSRVLGTIMGSVEAALSPGERLIAEPIELRSADIRPGMSGAAVLDKERNLVVGLVTERVPPNPDCIGIAYATDNAILGLEPFGLNLQDQPLPTRKTLTPRLRVETAPLLEPNWNNAPHSPRFVGRKDIIRSLHDDWANPNIHITCIKGPAGVGKTALARHWAESLATESSPPRGMFWWSFAERPDVPAFTRDAYKYMCNSQIDLRLQNTVTGQIQALGAMLERGRYLFVLDGLDSMLHSEGDHYGLLESNDLRSLLHFFASSNHDSFCLINSRLPVLDMIDELACKEFDLQPLSEDEGVALLKLLEVKGAREDLEEAVKYIGGHALDLTMLASDLVRNHNGDIKRLRQLPVSNAEDMPEKRVGQLLFNFVDLSQDELWLLQLFSIFAIPVSLNDLDEIILSLEGLAPHGIVGNLQNPLEKLYRMRLINRNDSSSQYWVESLVGEVLYNSLPENERIEIHAQLLSYFLKKADESQKVAEFFVKEKGYRLPPMSVVETPDKSYPADPRLPLMEAVRHACQAKEYNQAYMIYRHGIQGDDWSLAHQLGAYETDLALLRWFFPDSDFDRLPQATHIENQSTLVNQVGYCLMNLGRPAGAVPFVGQAV
jgi:hypothetical protein